MYDPEYVRALTLTRELHKRYRTTISTSVEDVRLAVYYLQGGCITQANFAIRSWGIGDLNAVWSSKRFIDEATRLSIFLVAIKDRDRYLKRFFKDEIITINPEKYKDEIIKNWSMSDADFINWLELAKTLSHGFSKGVHPTLRSVAYNSDVHTGEFDYDALGLAYSQIKGFDFAHFIIIPTINCVTLTSALFGVEGEDLKEIYELRDRIQSIAIKNRQTG